MSDNKDALSLNKVTFDAYSGECIGIIGKNGSGKSTLLKILSGVTAQTSGSISIKGRISSLLELGCGFNPEYTGISNIYLNGSILGFTKKETKKLIPRIIDFADIGDHINKPVKTYSDGMFLRLAFACAISVKPDILIIDEALAVGDFAFRQKCFNKIVELKKGGVTILMVSHDIDVIRRFCDRCLWLSDGRLLTDGKTEPVTAAYMESVTGCADILLPKIENKNDIKCTNRFGSAIGTIESVKISSVLETNENFSVKVCMKIPTGIDLSSLALSISIKNQFGQDLVVYSTADTNQRMNYGKNLIELKTDCLLSGGEYSLSVSLENRSSAPITYYDYIENAAQFKVICRHEYFGIFHNESNFIISGDNIE